MAIGSVATLGTNNSTSSGTSLVITTSAQLDAGNIGLLAIAANNVSTTDQETSEISSVVDSAGNTWNKLKEWCNGNGSAGAGCIVSIWFTKAASNLASGGTITITFANTITSKAASAWEFTVDSGKTLQIATGGSTTANIDADALPSMSLSSLSNKEYLFFRGVAQEQRNTGLTATSSWTKISDAFANTGANGTSMAVLGEFRVLTATGATSLPRATITDNANILLALEEIDTTGYGQLLSDRRNRRIVVQ